MLKVKIDVEFQALLVNPEKGFTNSDSNDKLFEPRQLFIKSTWRTEVSVPWFIHDNEC